MNPYPPQQEPPQTTPPSESAIPWHPAFVQALKMELEPYQGSLEFITEYQLTSEPLKIDLVIVKKDSQLVIEKNIARRFKKVNILEYKSPDDTFSVFDSYKALTYASLYAIKEKTLLDDITVTIVASRHPTALFKYLAKQPYQVTNPSPGIYRIRGYGYPVEIQFIKSPELPEEENLWLKGLTKHLRVETAKSILEEREKRKAVGREEGLMAYWYALFNANPQIIEEVLKMKGALPFDEMLEELGFIAKWEARGEARGITIGEARGVAIGEARGEARGKAQGVTIGEKTGWEKAVALLKQGYTVEQLERMIPQP